MGRITIKDIAEYSDASITTVSRVISNPDYPVAGQTRQRILQAIEKLGYVKPVKTNRYSRKADKEIGVILPTITNPFYAMTFLGIESEFQSNGYNILLYNSFRDPEYELKLLNSLFKKGIKGVILSSMQTDGNALQKFVDLGMNLILLDQKVDNTDCDHIFFDYREGAQKAVRFLYETGHERICLATTPLTRWTRNEIYEGYRLGLADCGLPFNKDMVIVAGDESESHIDLFYENRSGQLLAREFMRRDLKATAVFCVNDMVAFGFIRELGANDLRVPGDISVIGFDDIPFAEMFSPSLTTVHCPAVEIGSLSAQLLRRKLNEDISAGFNMKLVSGIVVRDSTLPPTG